MEKNDPAIIPKSNRVFQGQCNIVSETLESVQEEGECFDDFFTEVKLLS